MGYGCCGTGFQTSRSFLTKEERIALLKEYKDELEKESQGIVEKIRTRSKLTTWNRCRPFCQCWTKERGESHNSI